MKSMLFLILMLAAFTQVPGASWQPIAPMLSPRQEYPSVHLNGKIYVAGGMNSDKCCNALNNFEVYDIAQNKWSVLKSMPVPTNHPGIAVLNGKIYIIGGWIVSNIPTDRCFVYNVGANSWTEIDKLDRTTGNPGVCVYNGKIWVFGGTSVNNGRWDQSPNKTVQVYDPGTGQWSTVNSSMPLAKTHIGVGIVNNKAYISPGRPPREDDSCQEFDFSKASLGSAAWRQMAKLPSGKRTGYVSTWPVVDGKLYYIGGETASSALNTVHVFDPLKGTNGTWSSFSPSYPSGLHGVGPVAVGNKIYVMGGGTSVNVTGRTDKCYVIEIGTASKYTLSVVNGTGDGSYTAGTPVSISADTPPAGKQFDKWTGSTGGIQNVSAGSTTLTMPAANTTVTATYKDTVAAPAKYALTVNNGTGDGSYTAGTQVTIKAYTPASGKVFDKWTGSVAGVKDVNASTTTLAMPAANTAVTATYKDQPAGGDILFFNDFNDGNDNGWTRVNGTWSVINGEYVQTSTSRESRSVVNDAAWQSSWKNYAVEAKFMLTAGNRDAGLVARYKDGSNFYFMEVKSEAYKIQRNLAGKWYTVQESVPNPPVPHNVWMQLRFEVEGTTLRHYVNGELMLEGTDNYHAGGKVGVRSFDQAQTYDNFTVRTLGGTVDIRPAPEQLSIGDPGGNGYQTVFLIDGINGLVPVHSFPVRYFTLDGRPGILNGTGSVKALPTGIYFIEQVSGN